MAGLLRNRAGPRSAGKNAETKQLPNGVVITKFSVAATKSRKNDRRNWKSKTQ